MSDGDAEDLDGRIFLSTQVNGRTLVEGTQVRLTFGAGQVSANAGCNTMSGAAGWDGGTLTVGAGELATTMIGCPPDLQAQDEWLAGLLTSSPALALDGDTLTLGDETSGLVLSQQVDVPLLETTWAVESLVSGDAASSLPAGVEAGLSIDAAGSRLSASTGCNTGSGPVAIEASAVGATGTLNVGPLATTQMACPAEAMAVEAQVLTVLDGRVDYRIEGSTLTLSSSRGGLVLTAQSGG